MDAPVLKIQPSARLKFKSNKETFKSNRKVMSKAKIKGQTKSQANIKKYFKSKERVIDSNRDSENKRTSVNSGTIATTTSTNQKMQNFSSMGSFRNRKNSKFKLFSSKITDTETNLDKNRGKTSISPDSDNMNLESVRKSKIAQEKE